MGPAPNATTRGRYARVRPLTVENLQARELKAKEEERQNERHSLRRFEPHEAAAHRRLKKKLKAQEQEQERLDELHETSAAKNNGMLGPARLDAAFSSRHDFTSNRICETPGAKGIVALSSKLAEESLLSYSYRMGRERLSLHESAPGSRWPQRLSAQRNCGFAGGVRRRLRKGAINDDVEKEVERVRRGAGRRREIAVPKGLQGAMAMEIKRWKERR